MLEIVLDVLSDCLLEIAGNRKNSKVLRVVAMVLGCILGFAVLIYGAWQAYVSGNDGMKTMYIICLAFACVLGLLICVSMRQRRRNREKKMEPPVVGPDL